MNNMMKLTIAMLVCMAALMGSSVAATIEIDSCNGFGMIPLAAGEVVQEDEYTNGPTFWFSENGMVQYLGDPVDVPSYTSINYVTYLNNAPQFKTIWITLMPCVAEVPVCEFTPLRDTRIEIYEPTELGQEIETSIRFPGNGAFSSIVYLDGVESVDRVWNGQRCIIVEALVNGAVYARDGITV